MTDEPQGQNVSATEEHSQEIQKLLRLLGQIFSNLRLYSADHKVTEASIDQAYEHLVDTLREDQRIDFSVRDDTLLIDGKAVDLSNPLIATFARKLKDLMIAGFSFVQGMSRDELKKLVEIINMEESEAGPPGHFAKILSEQGLLHIKAESVTYQRVTAEEVVIAKEELEHHGTGDGDGVAVPPPATEQTASPVAGEPVQVVPAVEEPDEPVQAMPAVEEPDEPVQAMPAVEELDEPVQAMPAVEEPAEPPPPVTVENIMAFLKGDVSSPTDQAFGEMHEVASDANKLAELILHASVIRNDVRDIHAGEPFADIVVGCLKQTYHMLTKDASAKTQKARKENKKTLMLLEKELLGKMRAIAQKGNELGDFETRITETVNNLTNEIEAGAIAAEFAKKQKAAAASEEKLLRYLDRADTADLDKGNLKEQMMEAGLTPEGWQQLMVRSRDSEGSPLGGEQESGRGGAGTAVPTGELTMLLAQLLDRFDPDAHAADGEAPEGQTDALIQKVDQEVVGVVERTEQKLDELEAAYRIALQAPATAEREKQLSRKKILEILAEIVQELRQPLSVISCAIQMLRAQQKDNESPEDDTMLALAESSGERLSRLIDRLVEISGMPATVHPDKSLIEGHRDT